MKTIWLAVAFSAVLAVPAAAQESLTVGSCPRPIVLARSGVWATATENQAAIAKMRANPARQAKVATVFLAPDGSYFHVLGLDAMEAHQGRIGRADYESMKAEYRQAVAGGMPDQPPSGPTGFAASFDRFVDRETEFEVYGTTNIPAPTGNVLYHTVQRIAFIDGCLITVNFGLPGKKYTVENLERVVFQLGLR